MANMQIAQSGQQTGRAVQPGDILIVIHDFEARSGDELTLRRSDRVQLIELDDGFSDGWYLGKHMTRGGTGLFPGVYTTRAPTIRTPSHSPANSTSQQLSPIHHNVLRSSVGSSVPTSTRLDPHITAENTEINTPSAPPVSHHTTYVQRTIGETLGDQGKNSDSPVMNETLNDIDEHITDLSTPRQTVGYLRIKEDSESEYSNGMDRRSFLAGADTDDDDDAGLDEATVRAWDHNQTAQHLLDLGVDPKHCDIFREQEISGDVILDMDQNFIYMQEFDFGVMGRRLKTWHKVRDFQRDVFSTLPRSKRSSDRGHASSVEDLARSSRGLASSRPSYTPPISEEQSDVPHPLQPTQPSKRSSWAANSHYKTTAIYDGAVKSEKAKSQYSRRHSSIDFGGPPDLGLSSASIASPQKKSSTVGSWSVPGTGSTQATTPTSSNRPSTKNEDFLDLPSPSLHEQSPSDFDRGYFSSNDLDTRKRNRLSKASRTGHSRQTSLIEQQPKRASVVKRHARLSSVGSIRDSSILVSTAASAYHHQPPKTRLRSASALAVSGQTPPAGLSPAVTNLENDSNPSIGSPALEKIRMQDRARKLIGFRTASEAVTPAEKSNVVKLIPSATTYNSSEMVASPVTGDTSPSGTPSLDRESLDQVDVNAALSKNASRLRPTNKQRTSAYTHGLLKIPPAEARKLCDHSGWMKKKSSSIMTTWKPRLFILRGRRLSYYYSENDTEERGVIDISGHKVLVANDDPTVTIHASVTGAAKGSSTPKPDGTMLSSPKTSSDVFYFKLIPPKTGFSRAVQFTKPAVHYFQVDTLAEGRKWMGEIMKSTIQHDLGSYETTNKQKTISLAKARARQERPPELGDTKPPVTDVRQSGLGIEMESTKAPTNLAELADTTSTKVLSMDGLGTKTLLKRISEKENEPLNLPLHEAEAQEMAGPGPGPAVLRA